MYCNRVSGHHYCIHHSGCHVNAKDEDKNTPLHYAAENGHLLGVRILLDAGAKLSARNDEEDTPVHTAAENGHLRSVINNHAIHVAYMHMYM